MTATATQSDVRSLGDSLREWSTEQESLDSQFEESLAALVAYQSHLDVWQRDLARERDEVRREREQLERDRTAATESDQTVAAVSAELQQARERIETLTNQLLTRTEELRQLDQSRAKLATELELAQAHERGLQAPKAQQESPIPRPSVRRAGGDKSSEESPVLGTIMEQFGKLQQQRAIDRQVGRKVR